MFSFFALPSPESLIFAQYRCNDGQLSKSLKKLHVLMTPEQLALDIPRAQYLLQLCIGSPTIFCLLRAIVFGILSTAVQPYSVVHRHPSPHLSLASSGPPQLSSNPDTGVPLTVNKDIDW